MSGVPETLFLRNVSLKKKQKVDIFDEYDKELDIIEDYDTLPEVFTTRDKWPQSCNLLCCNCNLSFRGPPWFIPINKLQRYNKDLNAQESYLLPYLVFCTPFCLEYFVTYVNDTKIHNKWDIHELIKEEFFLLIGKRPLYIPEAPLKTIMIQHRGASGISPHEYRELLEKMWGEILYEKCTF